MTRLACILAAPDLSLEPELVSLAATVDLTIVRRCLDAADLMAAASLEPQLPVVLTASLPRITRDLVLRLSAGRVLVGLAGDEQGRLDLLTLGVAQPVLLRSAERTLLDICAALQGLPTGVGRKAQGVWLTGAWEATAPQAPAVQVPRAAPPPRTVPLRERGGVVAVWGPPGSPGRTTTTLMLGRMLAANGSSVCLIDADTTAPSLLQVCGIAEHASSLVVACRFAERDSLDPARLAQTVAVIERELCALGGVGHPDQWADVRAPALASVIDVCRASFDLTLIDVGSGIDEANAGELLSMPRFEAATAAVAAADAWVAVAEASSLGLTRLLNHRPDLQRDLGSPSAIAMTAPHAHGSARAGIASLRACGIDLPIFELPRCSTEEVVSKSARSLVKKRRPGRGSGLAELQVWINQAVVEVSQRYGEGSTTTAVPTRANL